MATTSCYQHPDRLAGAVCRRCQRPICPTCMVEAPVGWQCHGCARGPAEPAPPKASRWATRAAPAPPTVRARPSQRAEPLQGGIRLTPAVIAIIAINIVTYLLTVRRTDRILRFAMSPAAVHAGQYYRLLTAAFLHANLVHIGSNMLSLAIFGPVVERELGRVRFVALYLLSALGGSVCTYLLNQPLSLGYGASGAVFGLFGAYYVICRHRGYDARGAIGLIIVNLAISFAYASTIDWRAHVGGLVVGTVVALAYLAAERYPPATRAVVQVAATLVVLGALGVLVHLPPGRFHV